MRLGVAFSESVKSLAELNSEVNDGTETDPRATLTVLADRCPATTELPATD
jgi:hypothetical protein